MPSNEFSIEEWSTIRHELDRAPVAYGLPMRRYGSLLVASFNIRKLGEVQTLESDEGRDLPTMRFLADVCRHFDLLAIQEVMVEMDGVRKLRDMMGPDFGLLVSDVVGTFPGEKGNQERLAFIYNRAIVRRSELVTEVTASRTKVLKTLAAYHHDLFKMMEDHQHAKELREYLKKLTAWEARGGTGRIPREPSFSITNVKHFLQFIRTPFAASFEVHGHPGLEKYRFLAVNAHLHFGDKVDRRNEAAALVEWILGKVQTGAEKHVVMLGDLNFDFDNPEQDLERIQRRFEDLGGLSEDVFVSFPFIFPHPRAAQDHPEGDVFRSNIRKTQTYDQIGIFRLTSELRIGCNPFPVVTSPNEQWGRPGGPDYGVFDFSDLFSRALNRKRIKDLKATTRKRFIARFEHRVSDHMPIWFRMPLPESSEEFSTEV